MNYSSRTIEMRNYSGGSDWNFLSISMKRLASLIFLIWAVQCQNCPPNVDDDIQHCVRPVAQFAEALGVDVVRESNLASDRLIPSMGSEVFRELCSKITAFSQCAQNAKHQCPNHITLALINASYGYLCSDGYDIFMKNADCLMKLDHDPPVRVCHDRTMSTIKNVSRDLKATMPQKLMTMCEALNYFAQCVETPVLNECGSIAWAVIERVLRDTTRTLVPTCAFSVTAATFSMAPPTTAQKIMNDDHPRRISTTVKNLIGATTTTADNLRESDKLSANTGWSNGYELCVIGFSAMIARFGIR